MQESFGRCVGVIGSGVAGLTAAYALSGRHRVTLYEADTRLGGHAHTHFVDRGDGTIIGLDSAFLVHNDRSYPTLCRLFDELGVSTQESDMSMSVRSEDTGLEYAGAVYLLPGPRHRRAAHRKVHERPPRLRRIPATDIVFHPAPTPIGTKMTTAVLESLGYRSMTGPRHGSELDALLRQVAHRDAEAFAALYDHTRSRVYGLVARVLRDSGYSEETTQEIYLEVWRTAEAYDSAKGSALSWLMTMAHRRAVDRVRAEQAAGQRDSRYGAATVERSSDLVADSAIVADEHRRVAACLGGLTDAQRQCIEMAYYGGLTYVEVSQRLSANLSTIKSRMRDALRGLRNCLGVP